MSAALTPGSFASRFAAMALLVALLAAVWLLLIAPLLQARKAMDEELRTSQTLRARFHAQAMSGTHNGGPDALLRAPTAAVAAAMLQTRLEAIIGDAGGTIERSEAMALPRRRGSSRLDPIGATAAFTATTAQLRQILLAIDAEKTATIVDELSVRADARPAPDRLIEQLRIELTVRAFRPRGARP